MTNLNDAINEYTAQLQKGQIQIAYRGIMTFMSTLKSTLESNHPDYAASGLYFGYMDMTYFAFTPLELKRKNLKIAIVYLHQENRFELWLGGGNRKVQAEYIELLKGKDLGHYRLSQVRPGVDSIIECIVAEHPDFENVEELMKNLEDQTIEFAKKVNYFFVN